jgi:c-di-GMP-binding flagellar brake protein YcgR
MLRIEGDRREHPRVAVQRPCKMFDPRTRRYLPGVTRDVSAGGVAIDVPRLVDLNPGDMLHVGVATKRRDQLLSATQMLKATVIRANATVDDHTNLAVRFENAQLHRAIEPQWQRLAA